MKKCESEDCLTEEKLYINKEKNMLKEALQIVKIIMVTDMLCIEELRKTKIIHG